MCATFKREDLKSRYDVTSIFEDEWHTYCAAETDRIIDHYLKIPSGHSEWLLNAGAGVYALGLSKWKEVSLDLFLPPIQSRSYPVCASVEQLPFKNESFGAVICVGEVLAYCDPATAISEFARVLATHGQLVCDFRSTKSCRYWLTPVFGRGAELIIDDYNGTPEKTWVYSPNYIETLLKKAGFMVVARLGTHTWSSIARRTGFSTQTSVRIQRGIDWLQFSLIGADLITIVAERTSFERQ